MATIPAMRDDRSAPFFDGAADRRLMIKHCSCGNYAGPERTDCSACGDPTFEWVAASGRATLVSWVVTHAKPTPTGPGETSTIGLVELEEGPWMYGLLLGTEGTSLTVGTPLVVDFVRPGDGETIPAFRRTAS